MNIGSAITGLVRNYFPVDKFAVTPEKTQISNGKRPDLTIEKYNSLSDSYSPYCFIEAKGIINSKFDFDKILDQLFDTVFMGIDHYGNLSENYSAYMIAIKGIIIGLYIYHSFSCLLNEY